MIWLPFFAIFTIFNDIECKLLMPFMMNGKRTYSECDCQCEPLILTPYIEAGNITMAQKLAKVEPLDGGGKVISYSGYLTVNKTCNSNLFFWFSQAAEDYEKAPVTLWLQGGPGVSSMFGLFQEICPFSVDERFNLHLRNYSWHLLSSLLFIDNPVGAGFSFTDSNDCLLTNEYEVGSDLYNAVLQVFTLFPDLQNNHFHIFGESYAGKYVPALAYTIYENNPTSKLKINLKGLGIGDGSSDPKNQLVYSDYVYQIGLVDEITKRKIYEQEQLTKKLIEENEWVRATSELFSITYLINNKSLVDVYNYAKWDDTENDGYIECSKPPVPPYYNVQF